MHDLFMGRWREEPTIRMVETRKRFDDRRLDGDAADRSSEEEGGGFRRNLAPPR
jgi:HAMP domain-containing protein